MAQLRDIKRRIGSVKSTQKITRAMELIASSRIIRAQQRVAAARPYADEMRNLMSSVARNAGGVDHPLLRHRDDGGTVGTIVLSSDRGLAGAYNSNVIRAAERDMDSHDDTRLFLVGKKAISYFKFRGYDFSESWQGMTEVRLVYTKFESALTQRPTVVPLLPVPQEDLEDDDSGRQRPQYEFEPAPEEILDYLLPRYVEGAVYQGMLEAAASEHAARRRAMKAATDNAEELIENLTRVYNQARQAEITTEIMEIVGGAEALTQAAETTERVGVS